MMFPPTPLILKSSMWNEWCGKMVSQSTKTKPDVSGVVWPHIGLRRESSTRYEIVIFFELFLFISYTYCHTQARQIFEEGLANVLTIRDFTQIFDAYAEFSEEYISGLMEEVSDPEAADVAETEKELDLRMKEFEELMDRRPFLVNEVLLRRNPNDVQEWEKRVALWGSDDEKVREHSTASIIQRDIPPDLFPLQVSATYQEALKTINPRKATSGLHHLFVAYAKFFEEGGAAIAEEDKAEPDIDSARKVFERAVQVPFRRVDELAEVWIEWAEMEVRNEYVNSGCVVSSSEFSLIVDFLQQFRRSHQGDAASDDSAKEHEDQLP
jgi:hypothetical protein